MISSTDLVNVNAFLRYDTTAIACRNNVDFVSQFLQPIRQRVGASRNTVSIARRVANAEKTDSKWFVDHFSHFVANR